MHILFFSLSLFSLCAFRLDFVSLIHRLIAYFSSAFANNSVVQVLVLLFAVIACAVAIPAAVPQPASPAAGATVGIQQRGLLEKRQIDGIAPEAGAENGQDLKGSSSYGYGY